MNDTAPHPVELTDPNALLTIEQFCKWTGISYRTWRAWCAAGTAPRRIRLGRGVRIKASDALAWAEARYED